MTGASCARSSARRRARASCSASRTGGEVETIVDAIPAAAWDEREAHDLHGLRFSGHEPLRPLLDHGAPLDAWTVPTHGHDVHQVAVGPIHAGVIESGHFRFHVVGERILHLDVRLFYKRRGLEAAAAGRPLATALAHAQRACAACAVTNSVAYAQACEQALGLQPDRELRRARTLLLELERVYNHLHDISAICAGVGFAAGTMAYATLKERAQRLNERLTGHRFLLHTVRVGASELRLDAAAVEHARGELRDARPRARDDLASAAVRRLAAGAAGRRRRADAPMTPSGSAPSARRRAPPASTATCAARARGCGTTASSRSRRRGGGRRRRGAGPCSARWSSTSRSRCSTSCCAGPIDAGHGAGAASEAAAIGVGRVESPRGATICAIEQRRRAAARDAPADRLLRQLARARPRGRGQPAPRVPAHQQELRALLRLRGPLTRCSCCSTTSGACDATSPRRHRRVRGSLAMRHVDAGSCNGCEHELTAAANPYYDLAQYGLGIVASPRHADVLLVTGAVTTRMRRALEDAYAAMPEPRLVAALGNCALGRNLLGSPEELAAPLEQIVPVDLRIPGCPPDPATIAAALLGLLERRERRPPGAAHEPRREL